MTEHNFQIDSAAISDRGLSEKRPQNEDSFLEMRKLGLFAVADGVGGAQAGDVASQMAMEILGEAFMHLNANGDAEDMMKIAIERANSAIFQMSSDLPQLSTMATTIVALHISGNIASIGHVGDSRLYRLDSKGDLYRETQDHSVVEEEVRAGRMTAEQAAHHPSRNVISRALGAESGVEVDMKTIMFDGNTKFLLCSDGITRHITDFELRELLALNAPPAEICQRMKEICYSRGAEDNLTAVIVNVIGHGAKMPGNFVTVPAVEDEATVATARSAVQQSAGSYAENFSNAENGYDEIPTRSLEMPASMKTQTSDPIAPPVADQKFSSDDDESYLMEETAPQAPQSAPPSQSAPPPASMASAAASPAAATTRPVEAQRNLTSIETEEKNDGFFGKILSGLIWLIVGALLGAAGYYFYQSVFAKPPEVPAITKMESSNPPFTTFENLKREVDADPRKYLETAGKSTPKDAADFYLLGRAYLLDRNYEAAKTALIEARNKMNEYSETANREVLMSDINVYLVIAQDKAAQTAFERERKMSSGGGEPVNRTNTNQ